MRTSKPNLSVNAFKSLVILLWNVQFWNNRPFDINIKLPSSVELCHKLVPSQNILPQKYIIRCKWDKHCFEKVLKCSRYGLNTLCFFSPKPRKEDNFAIIIKKGLERNKYLTIFLLKYLFKWWLCKTHFSFVYRT